MNIKKLVVTAMLIALAAVLSLIRVFSLPFGGEITAASMMPLVLIAYGYGIRTGVISGMVYGVIQMFLSPEVISAAFLPGEGQMALWKAIFMCALDYLLAYACLGISGVYRGKLKHESASLAVGALTGTLLRYLTHIVSGAVLWGSYAEAFFSQDGLPGGQAVLGQVSGVALSIVYSVIYNGLYMIPEILVTVIVTPFIYRALVSAHVFR